jgi:MSHA pilin protein MshC
MDARPLAPRHRGAQASAGFTLLELVVVLVLLGILSVLAVPKATNTSAMTLDSQSRTLVSGLLSAQLLAYNRGQQVMFCTSGNTYWVQVGASCPAPPSGTSTNQPIVVALSQGASFSAVPGSPLAFTSLGQPTATSTLTYRLAATGSTQTFTVSVATLTGYISLTSP